MKTTATITGFREVKIAADAISDRLVRGGMRDALTKAARPVTAAAKRKAPRETGALKKSIRQKAVTDKKKGAVTIIIGASRNVTAAGLDGKLRRPANYAHLVEHGTASRGVFGQKGKEIVPGNAPKPFLRPAWEENKKDVEGRYAREIGESVKRRAKQLSRSNFTPGQRRR